MKVPMMLQHTGGHINAFGIRDEVLMDGIKQDWLDHGGQRFDLAVLIMAALNISAAVLMVCGIMYDSWLNREWDFFFKTRRRCCNFIPAVHSAEIFPIVFAGIAILQGVFYVCISVAKPQDNLHSCKLVAQFVWPVLWIAPYTMLVVGLETTFRSLTTPTFSSQVRWHISVRVASVLALVIITWVPALVFPARGQCLVSLIWWTAPFAKVGVGLIFVLIFTFFTGASIITFQLLKATKVDRDRRIEASRIVLYLLFSSLVLILVLPFYIEITMLRRAMISSKIAMVALNLTGLIPGILHIICRSKADWTIIQGNERPWWSRQRAFKIPAPDIDICVYMDSPVSVQSEQSPTTLTIDPEKSPVFTPIRKPLAKATKNQHADRLIPPQPCMTEVPPPSKASLTHHSNISESRVRYSLFPSPPPLLSIPRDSVSTTFSEGTIEAPKPLFADQRDLDRQSNVTSATVEIGLRLSYPVRALDPIKQSPVAKAPDSPFRSPPPLEGSSPPRNTVDSPFRSPPPLYASQCSNRSTPDPNSPLYSKPAPHISPPPIRNMKPSRKINMMKSTRSDISILPTQPNDVRSPGQLPLSPRSNLLSPGWIFRTDNFVRSPRRTQGLGQATNKSLPPVPPGEAHRPASRWSPRTLKPRGISWSREIKERQDWI